MFALLRHSLQQLQWLLVALRAAESSIIAEYSVPYTTAREQAAAFRWFTNGLPRTGRRTPNVRLAIAT
jgi:hypothetical protein